MSSKIKVDTIENVAGSGNVSLGSGHNLVVPGTLNITGASTLTGGVLTNTLNTASGTTITVPTGKQVIGTDSATFKQPGMILQTAVAQSDSKITKDSTSWVDTGLFTLQFANALQTGSKVLCRFNVSLGEAFDNTWGSATYFSVFENTTNMGNATYGMANGNAQMTGNTSYTQYEMNRLTGEALFTPAVTNGTYKLYVKSAQTFTKTIGGVANTGSAVPRGATQLIIQEVAQ